MSDLTRFADANVLLAIQSGDPERAGELLADMLPGELATLSAAAKRLAVLADAERMRKIGGPAKPTGEELPGEHWNARMIRQGAEYAAAQRAQAECAEGAACNDHPRGHYRGTH